MSKRRKAAATRAEQLVAEAQAAVGWSPTRIQLSDFLIDAQARDDLGLVLRGHLCVEHMLDQLIAAMLPNAAHLKRLKLNFERKVVMARALGLLLPDEDRPLLALNLLRNMYAHDLQAELGEVEVRELFASVRSEWFLRMMSSARAVEHEAPRNRALHFVLVLVVGLDSKLERVAQLRRDVLELHGKCLESFAGPLVR